MPLRFLAYLWASPNTLFGLLCYALVGRSGGARWVDGVCEIHGGLVATTLRHMPIVNGAAALTLGHTVLGVNEESLHRTREHERVHVRQYERWGPFFLPAYFACSAWIALRGGNPYLDNPFEREAYAVAG